MSVGPNSPNPQQGTAQLGAQQQQMGYQQQGNPQLAAQYAEAASRYAHAAAQMAAAAEQAAEAANAAAQGQITMTTPSPALPYFHQPHCPPMHYHPPNFHQFTW